MADVRRLAIEERAFDPFAPPNLRHTKVTSAIVDGKELAASSWNGLVDEMVRLAVMRLDSPSAIKKVVAANIVEGRKSVHGYRYLPDVNLSVQGQDAQDAWRCVAQLAKATCATVEVHFFWRDKSGAYRPGEAAMLKVAAR